MKKFKMHCCILALLGAAGASHAATISVKLTTVRQGTTGGTTSAVSIAGSTVGIYDIDTGIVTMNTGSTSISWDINPLPGNVLFTNTHTDWSTGANSYSASAYSCVDGSFGDTVGASLCGNYNFGGNLSNESSIDYGMIPGTRSLGGDDYAIGPQQQGSDYATAMASWNGVELIMDTADWVCVDPLNPFCHSDSGYRLGFTAVPVPAAIWLFGSALGLIGWMRRKVA
jgi:hypothetical protein